MAIQIRPSAKKSGSKSPTTASRKSLQSKGQAMPGGRYPTPNVDFLKRAIKSIGRTPPDKRSAVVAWIKKSAKRLGVPQRAANLSNELKAIELAGALASTGAIITPAGGSGASKKPPKTKVSGGGLKTSKGKAIYAKLCAKKFPPAAAMKAAKKAEQGMEVSEMSQVTTSSSAINLAFPFKAPKGGKADASGDTGADVKAKKKLGLNNNQALKAYAAARKKKLPHSLALKAAKLTDRKFGDPKARAAKENSNSPKA